jgi:hypothetical protein
LVAEINGGGDENDEMPDACVSGVALMPRLFFARKICDEIWTNGIDWQSGRSVFVFGLCS